MKIFKLNLFLLAFISLSAAADEVPVTQTVFVKLGINSGVRCFEQVSEKDCLQVHSNASEFLKSQLSSLWMVVGGDENNTEVPVELSLDGAFSRGDDLLYRGNFAKMIELYGHQLLFTMNLVYVANKNDDLKKVNPQQIRVTMGWRQLESYSVRYDGNEVNSNARFTATEYVTNGPFVASNTETDAVLVHFNGPLVVKGYTKEDYRSVELRWGAFASFNGVTLVSAK